LRGTIALDTVECMVDLEVKDPARASLFTSPGLDFSSNNCTSLLVDGIELSSLPGTLPRTITSDLVPNAPLKCGGMSGSFGTDAGVFVNALEAAMCDGDLCLFDIVTDGGSDGGSAAMAGFCSTLPRAGRLGRSSFLPTAHPFDFVGEVRPPVV